MSNYYGVVGQSLRVNAVLNISLDNATSITVNYRKPDNTIGSVPGEVDDILSGSIHCDLSESILDLIGSYFIWVIVITGEGETIKTFGNRISILSEGASRPVQ
jgi:hypothetical protein